MYNQREFYIWLRDVQSPYDIYFVLTGDSDWDKISSSEYNLSSLQEDCKTGTKQSRFCFILGKLILILV